MDIQAPRGTYDILPPVSGQWQQLERVLREISERYAYQEIRFPMFEPTELFVRGVGETSDVVSKEMYTFQDKGDRSVTLRPEGTASCARALIEHSAYSGQLPVKWYYMGPMFRYDRPAAGRYRQFHQFGIEAFGSQSAWLDAEVITILVHILEEFGLKDYVLHLNSVGCPTCRERYRQELVDFLRPLQELLCQDCRQRFEKNPLRVLDCKVPSCQAAITDHPVLIDHLCDNCAEHYATTKSALAAVGIPFVQDNRLVRGLDYYTHTAFEVHLPRLGANSAVGGGGRYDGLVQDCGGPAVPGVGFAMGIERLLLALGEAQTTPAQADVFIVCFDPAYEQSAAFLLNQLRRAGIRAERDYQNRSAKSQMKYANRVGAQVTIMLGPEEMEQGFYTLRHMREGDQIRVAVNEIVAAVVAALES